LQTRLEDFEKQDAQVLAIAVDPPDKSREIVEAYGLTFPVLSDTQGEAIEAYGVVHVMGDPINETDIARPATFIVDREGRVAWRHLPENWRIRPRPDELLEELDRIP
jgi:peroxiredoxin Q/BCP